MSSALMRGDGAAKSQMQIVLASPPTISVRLSGRSLHDLM